MNKFRFTIKVLAIAIFMFAFASMAQAQATRTWVSGVGDDANPCSRTAPCKTFAGAVSKTALGGEIDCIDPGGFGAVTITKSLTIDGTGTFGSILAAGTTGVLVNGVTTTRVRLRGLSINGANGTPSPGTNGVRMIAGASLTIEDTVIDGFNTAGVNIDASTVANSLVMKNVVIRNCNKGVNISNSGVFTTAFAFDGVNINRSTVDGITAGAGTVGSILHSYIGLNGGSGISATTANTDLVVSDSMIANNATGISTGAGSRVRIARLIIIGNNNALGLGGTIDTGGNNTIMGNTTNQDPNGTLFQQK